MKIEHGSQSKSRKGSLRDVLYVLFSHKGKMAAFIIVLFGVVVVKTLLGSGSYSSQARLLVRLGRETVSLDPTATIGEIAQITRTYDWEVNSELEILRSREIAENVVDRLGAGAILDGPEETPSEDKTLTAGARLTSEILAALGEAVERVKEAPRQLARKWGLSTALSDRDEAVEKLLEQLHIETLQNTSVIALSYEEKDPARAREVLGTFLEAYLEKHMAVFSTRNSHHFFEQQVADLQNKLALTEGRMQSLKDNTGVSSLEEQGKAAVNRIATLELGLAETEGALAAATARVAELERTLSGVPETLVTEEVTGFSDYAADLMRSGLYELRLQEKELEAKYPEGDRRLEFVRERVREAVAMIEKERAKPSRTETRMGLNAAHQQMQIELLKEQSNVSALRSRLDSMTGQLALAKGSLKQLNDAEIQITRLDREMTLLTDSYNQYSNKLEEARIDQALRTERISNISVLQAPTLPVVPAGPGKMVRLALGLILSVIGGMGFAFFCEYVDHSIKTPEDVQEKLQLPTLASIPRSRQNTVHPVGQPPRLTRLAGRMKRTVPAQWDIPPHLRRHYVAFRERLLLAANGASHGHYVIGVTSCSRYEGVSTVAANLASSLSEMRNGTVLLVDANACDPSVHRIFQTRLSPGLLEVLANGHNGDGEDTVVHRTAGLSLLTAGGANGSGNGNGHHNGHSNGSPAKSFSVDHVVRFLQTAKQEYRFIVVDIPALDEDGSIVRLAGACDGIVLVVETERLRWEAISKARQQLQQWNTNVLGVLLNKRRFPVPNWVYSAL